MTLLTLSAMMTAHSQTAVCDMQGAREICDSRPLAAPEGIRRVREDHPDVEIYVAGVDEKLNDHAYIVPGLGDAGDRIFGTK